ncbi:NYN domain-containing protein [Salinivibrio kushneri]|uniref:NYN domain-containing protein n=1 Tax=Salinivibrio kushneri TaxID=1908198 RepID=UPI0022B2EA2A|nr:NYN domain-containing protein [Salinivibrio kushneri]WBA13153.1 NYN domain-containing protein [Salinivibrio kushneri]
MSRRTVAIFVDAGFFNRIFTSAVDPEMKMVPEDLAKKMWHYWIKHVDRKNGEDLYRIYYYDCPPLTLKAHHPITSKQIDFSKSDITKYKNDLHEALTHQPYVACRMGHLSTSDKEWGFIRKDKIHNFNKLIRGEVDPKDIDPNKVSLRPRQKGVDMKLGIDITSVVLKKLANKIILISGDSDFVPAAKLAIIEGAHFILDAMGRKVKGDLAEHIDGLKTFIYQVTPQKYHR